jgi:hypothetical protein
LWDARAIYEISITMLFDTLGAFLRMRLPHALECAFVFGARCKLPKALHTVLGERLFFLNAGFCANFLPHAFLAASIHEFVEVVFCAPFPDRLVRMVCAKGLR